MALSSTEADRAAPRDSLVTVFDLLLKHDPVRMDQKRSTLRALDDKQLRELSYAGISQKKRVAAFLANEELTRRGIPPCFRGLPDPNDDDGEQLADLLAIDLEWIRGRYPTQKIFQGRWRGLTSAVEKTRWATMRFICNWQISEMWKYVKGLGMTMAQEWECHYLHRDKLSFARDEIARSRDDVANKLRRCWYDRKLTLLSDEELATFKRWVEVWVCASMGAWDSPTRVAWLYTAKTGRPLTRQMASNIMEKLRRDLGPKACRL